MNTVDRRKFLQLAGIGAAVALTSRSAFGAAAGKRKFTLDLVPGAIGVQADQAEAIRLAHVYGFESVQPNPPFLAGLSDTQMSELSADLKAKGLVWGAAGMPVDFRKDDTKFQDGLKALPAQAEALKRAGASRISTWISPGHNQLTYVQNFRSHANRLREVADVLSDAGLRFGLEYVGTKTLWAATRYPFIHTMAETKDLLAEIGRDNVGFVLDSWHWYTAGETAEDLLTLKNSEIVACDLNDAPEGLAVDEQRDNMRELPTATGVIDVQAFLNALITIDYDGPIRAEPFNRELNALDNDAAAKATSIAMKKAFALVDSGV